MNKPRVAIVAANLDILGGQGVQARRLVDELRQDDYEVTFVPINPGFPAGLRWLRGVPYLRTVANQAIYLPSLARLARADVAHVFSASYWSFLLAAAPAMLAARLMAKHAVLHYHSGEADDHLANWGALVHPWLRLADEIVVPSGYLAGVFARHGYDTTVIPNVVDVSRFGYRERRPLMPHLLSTRNLEAHYGVDVVIRAFGLIKSRWPDATLTIAGYGSQEPQLRRLAAAIDPDRIRFAGRVSQEDIPTLYADADIFLNASTIDNQPVSILEAFAAGLPVISTGVGDIIAMLGAGEMGLVVPIRDAAALALAVDSLLTDPDRARRMARRARRSLERHTWPAVRDQWAAVYSRALDAPDALEAPEAP